MDFEAAWCPVCSRLIEPKRTTVPVNPPQPHTPAPPPTSPQSSRKYPPPAQSSSPSYLPPASKKDKNSSRKPAARTRGGLVQGTGRMKPNGTIKRADPTSPKAQQASQNPPKPIKYRTIIDQGPLPLYCSEECRQQDDKLSSGSVGTESSRSSSTPSESSISTASSAAYEHGSIPNIAERPQYSSPSVAVLAKLYNFPPPPPPAPVSYEDPEPYRAPLSDNGLIMTGRYLRELCSEPAKPQTTRHRAPVEPPKTIPDWNDGSHAWRSRLYNLSAPAPAPQPKKKKIVRSQLGDASIPIRNVSSTSLPDDNSVMLTKYAESLGRRSGTISPSEATVVRRERSFLPPGTEGKLLVPDFMLKARTGSTSSITTRSPVSSEFGDDDTASKCDSPKSPLSPSRRPAPETRSWSYDNLKTYPLMPMPPKKEKRTQISIVDGKEVRVEYEVETQQPLKRLFLFPAPVRTATT